MTRAVTLASVVVIVFAAFIALVWMLQRRLIYFPIGGVPRPADVGLPQAEEVTFATRDGLQLHGWFVAASREAGAVPPTVLVFNGNAGHRGYRAPLAAALQRHGLQVLLFDYRGYGDNPGIPSESGLASDSRAARAYVTGRPDVDPSRLVYFGESLGSAVAVDLAAESPPAALVLRSPFTSLAEIGSHHYPFLPVRMLLRDRFPSIDTVRRIRSPLLVIAGVRDSIVPLAHSQRLHDAATGPKELLVLPDADHNDYELLAGPEMIEGIVGFLRRVGLISE